MADLLKQYAESIQIRQKGAEEAASIALTAKTLKEKGRLFAAGKFYLSAHQAAWGVAPDEMCSQCLFEAIDCLVLYINTKPEDEWKALLALNLLQNHSQSLGYRREVAEWLANLHAAARNEYLARLNALSVDDDLRQAILISGFHLTGQLDGEWLPSSPGHHIVNGSASWDSNGIETYSMPSAFDLLIGSKDYSSSYELASKHFDEFTSLGLKGWASACKGFIDNDGDAFFHASEYFALDTHDNENRKEPHWSSVNVDCWAPYFKSRGHLSGLSLTPTMATDILRNANTLTRRSAYHIPDVIRHFHIIGAANGLIDGNRDLITSALTNCRSDLRVFQENQGLVYAYEFISHVNDLSLLKYTDEWISHLDQLLNVLDRIPDISDAEKRNIKSSLNVGVMNSLAGFENGWEYKLLGNINDERILHRVMLRVFRGEAETPCYSQIRHGPIEYGKDLVICRNVNGKKVNYFYSFKVGEMKKSQWNKDVRPQLEEMFQVKFDSPELNGDISETVGVLLWNDHLSPYVEPIVKGWLEEQKKTFGRQFYLMNIDSVVKYIKDNKLSGLLRDALRDEGVE